MVEIVQLMKGVSDWIGSYCFTMKETFFFVAAIDSSVQFSSAKKIVSVMSLLKRKAIEPGLTIKQKMTAVLYSS